MTEKTNQEVIGNVNKAFTMADNFVDRFWEMWQLSLGSLSWTQDQLEAMAKKYLEQSKVSREESNEVMEGLMKEIKNNQMQMKQMVQQAVKTTVENVDIPVYNYFAELNKKVEELSKQVNTQ